MSHVESWSLYKNSPRGAHFTSRDAPVIAPEAAEVGTLATNGTERQRASIRVHPINLREHTLNELREWSIGQRSSRPYVTRHADSFMLALRIRHHHHHCRPAPAAPDCDTQRPETSHCPPL